MRFRFWIITSLIVLLFSSCTMDKGEELVFFYDTDFGQVAEFTPDIFSGHSEPLFPELSNVAKESGYSLKHVPVDILQEDYLSAFQGRLPQQNKQVMITSFLYNVPEIQELLAGYKCAVVGAAVDIPLDKLKIIGNGFRVLEEEGRMLASTGQKMNFVALKSGFQNRITQAFLDGAGKSVTLFEVELNANSVIMPLTDNMIVASYGKCFKSFASSRAITGKIRVVNFPGTPDYVDPYMKKRVDAYICYDFATSFKSAILELASGRGEKKSFYSFDLVRR